MRFKVEHVLEMNVKEQKKIKLSLCFTNQALRHEGVWGSGCIDPCFLDLSTSWRHSLYIIQFFHF
jgi:hypothetical protein